MKSLDTLPIGYQENTLVLLAQSPRVLYAYWELSPCQKAALIKKGQLQLRLSVVNKGPYCTFDIQPFRNSFYFNGVEPELEYYCDINVVNNNGEFYPLIYSKSVMTPPEKPTKENGYAGGSSNNFMSPTPRATAGHDIIAAPYICGDNQFCREPAKNHVYLVPILLL